jgi:hypothetical protein
VKFFSLSELGVFAPLREENPHPKNFKMLTITKGEHDSPRS